MSLLSLASGPETISETLCCVACIWVCEIVLNLHKPLRCYVVWVCVCVCTLELAENTWLHACLQSACLHADRSILNHAAANLLQPQREKHHHIHAAACLPAVTQSTQLYYFTRTSVFPSCRRSQCADVGLHMKAWCNLSDHRASEDQVLWGMKLRHSFQLRVQVSWNHSGWNGTTNLFQSPAPRTVF